MRRSVACLLLAASLLPGVAAAAECTDWVAAVVSVQGSIQARRAGEAQWQMVAAGERYCVGDTIRAQARSRAALRLRNDALLRLDQDTTVTFPRPEAGPASWVEVLRGVVHSLSRVPRALKVLTPFVNGTVEGTEFLAAVEADRATLTVFEGRVAAENAAGRLTLGSGQSAIARAGQAPAPVVIVRPRDAVEWALYYPAIADARPEEFPDVAGQAWPARVRQAIEFSRRGDLPGAFASLEPAGPEVADPRFFTYRAGLFLLVGRVADARSDLDQALTLDPAHGPALALQAIVAVVQNDTGEALRLGRLAVAASPQSAAARVALSYAHQASFDLVGALESLEEAVKLKPEDSLAWARLAELQLSFGKVGKALDAARKAASLNPDLPRTQSVLGFAHLADLDTKAAQQAFERAIQLDQADPLPRLGLGLARIRRGDLDGGRRDLEIAASLDPNRSLDRSYLGKAYYEERRDTPAREEFATARALDPKDPTPWFYDAIRKQSVNRPVEALHDLQRAIELNENRAIFRSRLLLDEDLAARSASLARIYDDLGFQQLALVEGWKSVNIDPTNYSAHRFLADSYSVLPRHEIARVSEVLQSQLLQPLAVNPVPPQLGIARPFILAGTGPADPSFNEFDALFNRNRVSFLASGVAGGNDTVGDEVVFAILGGRASFSAGQFHYETDGFRPNNDLNKDVYNVFAQVRLSHETSVLTEFRYEDTEKGDLGLRFDPNNFQANLRQLEQTRSIRLGLRHEFAPGSELLASAAYRNAQLDTTNAPILTFVTDEKGYTGELQYLFRSRPVSLVAGAAHFVADATDTVSVSLPFFSLTRRTKATRRDISLYAYSLLNVVPRLTVTAGFSGDLFEGGVRDRDQANPKLGLVWTPLPGTTVRAAAFRALGRPFLNFQTLEPTQVAGFNQFFNDVEATEVRRYGVAVDQKLSSSVSIGLALSRRTLEIPLAAATTEAVDLVDWRERLAHGYLYWAASSWLAASTEYEYERLHREENPLGEAISEASTHRISVALELFGPKSLFSRIKATGVDQRGTFADAANNLFRGEDQFWVADASIGYRLPKRLGLVSVEGKNLLDKRFRYQDTDPANPRISPERLIIFRLTVAY